VKTEKRGKWENVWLRYDLVSSKANFHRILFKN